MIDLRMVIESNDKTVLQWRKWQVVHGDGFGKNDWGEWENVPLVTLDQDGRVTSTVTSDSQEVTRLRQMIDIP